MSMVQRILRWGALLALALTGAMLSGAQDVPVGGPTASGEYEGVLEDLSGDMLTVSGLVFDIAGVTLDDDVAWAPGTAASIRFSASGGVLTGLYVDDADGEDVGEGYLVGALEALDETSAVVGGLTFDITAFSAAQADEDNPEVFAIGQVVAIEFVYADGVFAAKEVETWRAPDADDTEDDEVDEGDEGDEGEDDPADEDEGEIDDEEDDAPWYLTITGVLEAYDGQTLTVSGLVIDLTYAVIDDDDDLLIGGYVTVVFEDVNGQAVAVFVIPHGTEDEDESDDDMIDDEEDEVDDVCDDPEGWYEYEVRRGDTLSGIATAAGMTVADLMAANCLTSTMIMVGQELYVPVQITSGGGSAYTDDDDDEDDNSDDEDGQDDDEEDDDEEDDDQDDEDDSSEDDEDDDSEDGDDD
jgi:hypothetical protein